MKNHITIASILASTLACAPSENKSELKQSIDQNSELRLSGFTGDLDYATLAQSYTFNRPQVAWTDSYWPSFKRGLSARWGQVGSESTSDVALEAFLNSHVAESKNLEPNAQLSPAEKYDLIYRWRFGKAMSDDSLRTLIESVKTLEADYLTKTKLEEKRSLMSSINSQLSASREFNELFPLSRGGWVNWLSRNAQKTAQFLDEAGTGDDWSWEGICHGWAPAALYSEVPKHAVNVSLDDKKILLTEGDIRGLLSYAWANYSPSGRDQFFIGRRCNEEVGDADSKGPVDESGRSIYGTIIWNEGDAKANFSLIRELEGRGLLQPWMNQTFNNQIGSTRAYEIETNDGLKRGLLLEVNWINKQNYWQTSFMFAQTAADFERFAQDQSSVVFPQDVDFLGCGDVNPAALHTTVLQKLSPDLDNGREQIGFVIDRTQSGQVWNQPVHAAKVVTKSKVSLFQGDQIKKYLAKDPKFLARFSPEATYVVPVELSLQWTSEPNEAQIQYGNLVNRNFSFDIGMGRQTTNVKYLLEFNDDDKLVGAEWGTLESPAQPSQIPDFIFGFKTNSVPANNLKKGFDYSGIIGKIHECSLSDKTDGETQVGDKKLKFTNCVIEKN